MLKRAIHSQFVAPVMSGQKVTTIRATAWPVGVPIMLFHWEGRAYRSRQIDVAPIIVTATEAISIKRVGNRMFYRQTCPDSFWRKGGPLWQMEGFASQEALDAWFRKLPGLSIIGRPIEQHIMGFRLATPEEVQPKPKITKLKLLGTRRGNRILHFDPPQFCKGRGCWGNLRVEDYGRKARSGLRYETYCEKCGNCDPNGWATQREVIENSPAYFQ